MKKMWVEYNVGHTMGFLLGHSAWQIHRTCNGSMWNCYSFQPVGPWMGCPFSDLGAEGCCRSLNALFLWHPLCLTEEPENNSPYPKQFDANVNSFLVMKILQSALQLFCPCKRGLTVGAGAAIASNSTGTVTLYGIATNSSNINIYFPYNILYHRCDISIAHMCIMGVFSSYVISI